MTTPKLSIVIVTFNSRADIERCLHSLVDAPPATAHEIILVDNASADGTAPYVRQHWPQVRVIDAGANLGFAKANNVAIRHSGGTLVLLLNPDTIVPAGAIDNLVRILEAQPDVAIVGPRIVDGDG